MAPVDLCLFARHRTQTKVGLGCGPGSQPAHEPSCLSLRTLVAAGCDHLVDSRGAEFGVLLEGGADEVGVGIEATRAYDSAAIEARCFECGAHGDGVEPELGRNGADAPVLGVEQATDLGALGFGDHVLSPSRVDASRGAQWQATEEASP